MPISIAFLSSARWKWVTLSFLLCMASAPLQAQAPAAHALPSLGDGGDMPLGEERRLGDSIAREIWRDPDLIEDPILSDYIQSIWQPLIQAARQRGELSAELEERFAWDLMLIRDKSVNAFALPGGYLGVHLGLIGVSSSRDELASVLAHELSHVTQRHIARLLSQQSKQSPLMMGAMVLGLLAASRNPQAANAMIVGGQAVAIQNQLNFSRDMEREADRVGYGVMTQAGFEPQGFVSLFEKLQQAARLNDSGGYPYLRSHPMTTERIADMQARQQLLTLASPAPPRLAHQLLSARARVLANPGVDGQRFFSADAQQENRSAGQRAAALYAGVMADLRLRDHGLLRPRLEELRLLTQTDPEAQQQVRLLSAEVALQTGTPLQAIALLGTQGKDRASRFLLAQSRIATGLPAQGAMAAQDLLGWTALHPRDPFGWELLGQALNLQGDGLRAIRAQAESLALKFDYAAAIDRLVAAQELARQLARTGRLDRAQEMEAAIIDSRLRTLQIARREQALQR